LYLLAWRRAEAGNLRRDRPALVPALARCACCGEGLSGNRRASGRRPGAQVYRICPQALLPVLPHLERELQAKEDAKRLAAAGLVGRLFGAAGSDMDAQCASLFSEFVRRFRDLRARPRRSAPPPACRGRLQCRKPRPASCITGAHWGQRAPGHRVRGGASVQLAVPALSVSWWRSASLRVRCARRLRCGRRCSGSPPPCCRAARARPRVRGRAPCPAFPSAPASSCFSHERSLSYMTAWM